ncbi:MAG: FKBP-type peptidyl-prolyl cis-trans isomerase [Bacteroidota bacterium]|nr:FKBP-type peptidyl-prolyl cis-trans isomerase [Bacteroidota bacterium]
MTKFFISLVVLIIISFSCSNKENVNLEIKNELDSVSYFIGLILGENLPRDGFDTTNTWLVAKGLSDYYENNDLLIEVEDYREFIEAFASREKIKKYLLKYGGVKLEGEKFLEENSKREGVVTLPSGLQYRVIKEGNGPKPKSKDLVMVYYKGWLLSGEVFDEHLKRDPIPFKVDRIIPGWTEALQLMKEGAKWQLFIPYDLAYGTEIRPSSIVVPYSMLTFEIELVKVGSD